MSILNCSKTKETLTNAFSHISTPTVDEHRKDGKWMGGWVQKAFNLIYKHIKFLDK